MDPMRYLVRLGAKIAPVVLTASMLTVASGATARAVSDGGWVYVDNTNMPFSLQNAHTITLQGAPDSTGRCQATLTLGRAADEPPVTAVEMAYNESTCQQLIAIGTASPQQPEPTSSGSATSFAGQSGLVARVAAPATLQRHGYFYTYWHDPAWLNVNSVEDEMTWNYSSPFIMGIVAAWDDLTWLSASGWYVTSHPAPVLTVDYNDYWATLTTRASFYNTMFCGGTGTTYQPNTFKAYGDGRDTGSVSTWDWGCHSDWLHFASTLY